MLADLVDHVIGIDPDRDRIQAVVVHAKTLAVTEEISFPTTTSGYAAAIDWADEHTETENRAWAIEGTGSYGSGIAQILSEAGELVVEFDHPQGPAAPDGAKSDALDAVRAAREVLGRTNNSTPRARGNREAIRTLLTTRNSYVKERTRAINSLKSMLISAPTKLRDDLSGITTNELIDRCARLRPQTDSGHEMFATKTAMRSLARQIRDLEEHRKELDTALEPFVDQAAPQLLNEVGVGYITAAQILVSWSHQGRCRNEAAFNRLAGTAPIPATSGQNQNRHRLNRGGDRQLNAALHRIVLVRAQHDPATKAYINKRTEQGKTRREARRCLKRYIGRHIYRLLENPPQTTT